MKIKTVRPPVTGAKYLADEIEAMATLMWLVSERMEYFGGFKGEILQHSHELAGAATIARGWAKAMREKPEPSTRLPDCVDCKKLKWHQNSQPRYGVNGRTLCWTHAHVASSPKKRVSKARAKELFAEMRRAVK